MKTKTPSKKSLKKRLTVGDRLGAVIPDKPVWDSWKPLEIHDIKFDGFKFQAGLGAYNNIWTGKTLSLIPDVRQLIGYTKTFAKQLDTGNANSCSYARVMPSGTGLNAAMWGWWLHNVKLNHGTIAYLIPSDGSMTQLKRYLKERGFIAAAVTKSIHHPGYPVYLFVHTGDKVLRQIKTTRVDFDDADILGVTTEDGNGFKSARDRKRSNAKAAAVPAKAAGGAVELI
jgi:hypothetical protein